MVPSPERPLLVHLDADAFFAACEVDERHLPLDTPLAVASSEAGGSVITCSYPARAAGVERGQRVREAKALCPALVVAPQRPPLYVERHHEMRAAVDALAPVEHAPSIDELCLRVPGREDPEAFVRLVASAVPAALGEAVQVSVGAGPSWLLAKMAAGSAKPRGRTVARSVANLSALPVRAVPGVGPALEGRVVAAGVRTVGALHAAGPASCRAAWGGRTGRDVWMDLEGWEVPPHNRPPRSVSHGRMLGPGEDACAVLRGLAVLVGERARALGRPVRRIECWGGGGRRPRSAPRRRARALSWTRRPGSGSGVSGGAG